MADVDVDVPGCCMFGAGTCDAICVIHVVVAGGCHSVG
jgi:hypothetical protein